MDKEFLRILIAEKVNNAIEETFKLNESKNINEIERNNEGGSWIHHDYAAVITGLNSNSTTTRIKILDKLLSSQIVDTQQQRWDEMAQSLRKCFVSANGEVFTKALQVHHRIIAFPNSSTEGYLNLLKSAVLLLNSRYYNEVKKSRVLETLQLIVGTQSHVFKLLLHASRAAIDAIVAAFVDVLTFKSVFDLLAVVDPESTWLKSFCYGAYIRDSFFGCLKEEFPKFVTAKFVENEGGLRQYGSFLLYFWGYKTNLKFLSNEQSPETTLEIVIHHQKKQETVEFLLQIFASNPHLLTPKLLDVLTEPLFTTTRNNSRSAIEAHSYIFTIISTVAKSPNFRVLFGGNLRKVRPRRNLHQKIVDLTVLSLRNEDDTTLPLLLDCCTSIYSSHPAALLHVNPAKLLQSLQEFYRLSWKNEPGIRRALLTLFEFFFTFYGPTVRILGCDEILIDLFSFTPFLNVMMRISGDKNGFEFIKKHSNQIVRPHLERASEDDDSELSKFVFFISVIKLETRSVVALLCDDEEGTVVESNDKSTNLVDLTEKSLSGGGDSEEFLGLLTMKVLITNLDLLLYLQVNYRMQEKLADLDNGIIDAQSCLRSGILASLGSVGFGEKPPQTFQRSEENELRASVESGSTGDANWVAQARRAFKNSLDDFDPPRLVVLIQRVPKTYVYRKIELNWPPSDCVYYQLHPEDCSGVSLVVSFGEKTGLLKPAEDASHHQENLTLLIKQSRTYLRYQPEHFFGFDWFVGVVYLISCGDFEESKSVLINFTNTQVTALIWSTFGKELDEGLQESFYQHFVVVLEENCQCYHALKMLGISPEVLAQSWLRQCFFNCLSFGEICNFLSFSLLYPVEGLIYYLVAVFEHLNAAICTLTHSLTVENILKMAELREFELKNYMSLIESLMKRYKNSHKL